MALYLSNRDWDTLKNNPLKDFLTTAPHPGGSGKTHSVWAPGFEAAVERLGETPMGALETSQLMAVTSGLLHNLRHTPTPYKDSDYIGLVKSIWHHHTREMAEGTRTADADPNMIKQLADDIARIAPRRGDHGEKLPEPLEWFARIDLHDIGTMLDKLSPRIAGHTDIEDRLVEWTSMNLARSKITSGKVDGATREYTLDLANSPFNALPGGNAVASFLRENGAVSVKSAQNRVKVTVAEGSPLGNVLASMSKMQRSIGG